MMEGRKEEEDHPECQVPGAHFTEAQTEALQRRTCLHPTPLSEHLPLPTPRWRR